MIDDWNQLEVVKNIDEPLPKKATPPAPNGAYIGIRGDWKRIEHLEDGTVVSVSEKKNVVTLLGRDELFKLLLGFSAEASGSPIVAMGVGASAVTGDSSDPNDVGSNLQYELIADSTRQPIYNSSAAALSTADIVSDETTISSVTYYRKVVVQSTYGNSDPNNGNVFKEYGLFTTLTLPGTPTGSSGVMFNRFEDPDPITKTASNAVTVQVTLRL